MIILYVCMHDCYSQQNGNQYIDTINMSNRINNRVRYSDTMSMLMPYLRMADTISLSNRINQIDTSKWRNSGVNIFNKNSGNVGIGTSAPNSSLHVNGSISRSYRVITSTTTLGATDGIVYVNNGATNITITLPAIDGRIYQIARIDNSSTGVITLRVSGGTIQANGGGVGATTTVSTVAGQRSVSIQITGTVGRRLTIN